MDTALAVKKLRCRARSEDFGRKLSPRFVLSKHSYGDTLHDQAQSPFMNMPVEILQAVFRAVECAPSQITLALSCKRTALMASELDLQLSTTSAKYAGFLPVRVFDVPPLMKQLSAWMPSRLRLCDHCLTNRPHDKTYWEDIAGCEGGSFWITKTGWSFSGASWHKRIHNICPACHVSCSLSDYVDCDGCRALGRLGDVDWNRVSDHWRRRSAQELQAN